MSRTVSCVPTGVQPGNRRFPDILTQPLIKNWRCELTALSQVYNLYFVACNDEIHIYRPSFPNQSLANEPDLIIRPPVSSPDLEPTIDLLDPHSITRLHVDFLGREEVLLVTCDDGDVIGYRVPEIHRAIETTDPGDDAHVRVFLHRNVGKSAWGLAVHREARLVAISANTFQVTVIAYALADTSADSDDSQVTESACLSSDEEVEAPDFPFPRRREHILTLLARHNIPSVSFDNTGQDPSGRWLFSSSIDGSNHLWDLHQTQHLPSPPPAGNIRLGYCEGVQNPQVAPPCQCRNSMSVPHAAWAAMFVDARSCHETRNAEEAFGFNWLERKDSFAPWVYDITNYHEYLPRNTPRVPLSEFYTQELDLSDLESLDLPMADGDDSDQDQGDIGSAPTSATSANAEDESANIQDEANEAAVSAPSNEHPSNESPLEQVVPPTGVGGILAMPEGNPQGTLLVLPHDNDDDDGGDDAEATSEFSADSYGLSDSQIQAAFGPWPTAPGLPMKRPFCDIITSSRYQSQDQPPRPCIVITKEEIYLLQRPFKKAKGDLDPIITMRNPLFLPNHIPHDRMCFATQISELGVFIVGSPAGRVGIFRLTKFNTAERGTIFGFRLDHLLPFLPQKGENVFADIGGRRIAGVAVGPVQGMLDQPEDNGSASGSEGRGTTGSRRWRLMITLIDHTVISYELGRYRQDASPGLGDLVV